MANNFKKNHKMINYYFYYMLRYIEFSKSYSLLKTIFRHILCLKQKYLCYTISLFIVFVFSFKLLGSSTINNDEKKLLINEQLRLADGLVERGYFNNAINEYENLISRFPNNRLVDEAWAQLAYAQSKSGNIKNAFKTYQTFLKNFPNSPIHTAVKINYARLLGSQKSINDKKKSLEILKNTLILNNISEPLKEAAQFYTAEIYSDLNEHNKAFVIYSELSSKSLSDKFIFRIYALFKIAERDYNNKMYNQAILHYERIIEKINSNDEIVMDALQSLAMIYIQQLKYDSAAIIYGRLITRFSGTDQSKKAEYYRLECLYRGGKYTLVVKESDSLLSSDKSVNKELIYYLKASSLMKLDYYSSAYTCFTEILETGKDSEYYQESAIKSIICLLKQNRNKHAEVSAIDLSNSKILTEETKEAILELVAKSLHDDNKLIAFWTLVQESVKGRILSSWISYNLGMVLENSGQFTKALRQYDKILKSDDQLLLPFALNGIISCRLALGSVDDTQKFLDRIINQHQDSPVFPNAVIIKTELLIKNNQFKEALELLNKYQFKLSDTLVNNRARFYLGSLLFIEKKWDKSEGYFLNLLLEKGIPEDELIEVEVYLGLIYIEKQEIDKANKILIPLIINNVIFEYCSNETILKLSEFFSDQKNYNISKICFNWLVQCDNIEISQEALVGLANIMIKEDKSTLALQYLRKASLIGGDTIQSNIALNKLGELLVELNRNQEAVLVFQKILSSHTDKNSAAEARFGMAEVLSKDPGRLTRANYYAMSVFILSNDPKLCIKAMILSIRLSIRLEKLKEAKNTFNELIKRFPDALKLKEVKSFNKDFE